MFSAYRVLLNISVINTLSCSHLQHMGHAYQAMKNITWIVTSFSFTQSKSLNIFAAHASKTWSTYHMMPKWKRVGKQCTHCLIWFNKTLKNIKRLMTKNAHFLFSTGGGVGGSRTHRVQWRSYNLLQCPRCTSVICRWHYCSVNRMITATNSQQS